MVLPAVVSVRPLDKTRVTVAPFSPVPEIVKPCVLSDPSIILSIDTVFIVGALGTRLSIITPARSVGALTLLDASVANTRTVYVPSTGNDEDEYGSTQLPNSSARTKRVETTVLSEFKN